ncbi:MAG: DUF86 domain-containing protein [bacterium]
MMIDQDRISKNKLDIISVSDQMEGLVKQAEAVFLADSRNSQALKYLLIEAVEAMVDTCQHILAKTKGIACEGYVDCLVKAGQEGLISLSLTNKLRRLANLRNSLIHRYWIIDEAQLYHQTAAHKADLREFVREIDNYLVSLKAQRHNLDPRCSILDPRSSILDTGH